MHPFLRPHIRVRQQGQTLIIALIVLGVLLILGLVFLGLVDRNLRNAARGQSRSQATDLAEAGIRFAHGQLVSSLPGADWRGTPTQLTETAPNSNVTGDPDAYYLRPASGLKNLRGSGQDDLGGPDDLGPFIRVQFPQGRALVRVRYGASDASTAKLVAGGPLRNPGVTRSTLIIEAVGRPGVFRSKDPTTFNASGGLQFKGFTTEAELTAGIAALAQADGQLATSRRMVAFAPIGIIDAARFETNVFNSSAPIPLGISSGLGIAAYDDAKLGAGNGDVGQTLESVLGTSGEVASTSKSYLLPRGEGSLIVNGDLALYGNVHVYMNRTLGDTFRVGGRILDGDGAHPATLTLTPSQFNVTKYDTDLKDTILTSAGTETGVLGSFDSQSPLFNTAAGLLLDGSARTDTNGYPSGAGTLVPPSAQTVDPQTKLNRYVAMTRESGQALGTQNRENNGAFGHGAGVYVDNAADRQEASDAQGRQTQGSQRSLFDDWLNPDSGAAGSGWQGPFYVPAAAVVQLLPDGFTIQRYGSATTEKYWKGAAGGPTSLATIRYRLGRGTDGQVHILDTLTTSKNINDTTLKDTDFQQGPVFNGVLYFEGNVRVRGTIPTGVQMTLVSGATIYIDGSITKGITANEVTGGTRLDVLDGLPTATLMLMAKDNVAVNTPNFFGPPATQTLEVANDVASATTISPVKIKAAGGTGSGQLDLLADLALDPNDASGGGLTDPRQWTPYAMTYTSWESNANLPNNRVPTEFLLAHTMDDGTASASFLALDVNFGALTGTSTYSFTTGVDIANPDNIIANTAATYLYAGTGATPTSIGIYGLGAESWQRYAKFETRSFPLVPVPGNASYSATGGSAGKIIQSGVGYTLFSGGNDLLLRPGAIAGVSTNDLLVGRAAVTPSEIKIEASIFAEQGSFFVIPGPWFNPQPNDNHEAFESNVAYIQSKYGLSADLARLRASRERLEAYGSAPGSPFYGEPLDVRLSVIGSVAENLPPPIAVQSEWVRKWGWIPRRLSATGIGIPGAHVPGSTATDKTTYMNGGTLNGVTVPAHNFVPNLTIQYDPVLATGRLNDPLRPNLVRVDEYNRPLPPMPRLPVSPKLAYFGEL